MDGLTAWLLSVEGTETGARVALGLALFSAAAHAGLGAIQKGRHDPWLSRGAIDIFYFAIALPFALLLPPIGWDMLPFFVGAWAIHVTYKVLMAAAYSRGAYTVVYPVVRGASPLVTVVFAGLVFGETLSGAQWLGLVLLSGAIMGLALVNLRGAAVGRPDLVAALGLALLTGVMVAAYTTYDAYGVRLVSEPFTFLAWFFVMDGWTMPIVAAIRYRRMAAPPALGPLMRRGLAGALIAICSFGAVILATRLDKVGEVAAIRETSTVFAALFGWLFLKETVGPARAVLIILIALGAVVVELA